MIATVNRLDADFNADAATAMLQRGIKRGAETVAIELMDILDERRG